MVLSVDAAGEDWGGRVLVSVSSSPTVTAPLDLLRVHPDGTSHRVISPDLTPYLTGGSWSGYDYHAPVNQLVTYSAVAGGQSGVSSVPALVLSKVTILAHPTNPDLTVVPDAFTNVADRSFDVETTAFKVLDRALPVHVRDRPRSAQSGAFTVVCDSLENELALRALLADGGPILVNGTMRDLGWLWIQPGGVSWETPGDKDRGPYRLATISYEATTQPDEASEPQFTCDDLAATGWTCDQAATHYADCNGMALDIRIA